MRSCTGWGASGLSLSVCPWTHPFHIEQDTLVRYFTGKDVRKSSLWRGGAFFISMKLSPDETETVSFKIKINRIIRC